MKRTLTGLHAALRARSVETLRLLASPDELPGRATERLEIGLELVDGELTAAELLRVARAASRELALRPVGFCDDEIADRLAEIDSVTLRFYASGSTARPEVWASLARECGLARAFDEGERRRVAALAGEILAARPA